MKTELAVRGQSMEPVAFDKDAGTLVVATQIPGMVVTFQRDQAALTKEQMMLLAPLRIGADWDWRQVAVFLMECQKRQLDPWGREVYLMRYKDRDAPEGFTYVTHIGIEGYRTRAESSGQYEGQEEPLYSGPDGEWREVWPNRGQPPYAAKVGVLRAGFRKPVYGIAHFEEYAGYRDLWEGPSGARRKVGRELTPAWRPAALGGKACVMLAKVAEALALRRAFPRNFHGLYLEEEFYHLRGQQQTPGDGNGETEVAQRRRAAYAAAQAEAPGDQPAASGQDESGEGEQEVITVQATVDDLRSATAAAAAARTEPAPEPDPVPAKPARGEATTRRLLLDELTEQAEVLGHSVDHLTARWSARRGGVVFAEATVDEIAEHVHRIRPVVLETLRGANREAEAHAYAHAPEVGTCQELFGRGRHVPAGPTPQGGEPR